MSFTPEPGPCVHLPQADLDNVRAAVKWLDDAPQIDDWTIPDRLWENFHEWSWSVLERMSFDPACDATRDTFTQFIITDDGVLCVEFEKVDAEGDFSSVTYPITPAAEVTDGQ